MVNNEELKIMQLEQLNNYLRRENALLRELNEQHSFGNKLYEIYIEEKFRETLKNCKVGYGEEYD